LNNNDNKNNNGKKMACFKISVCEQTGTCDLYEARRHSNENKEIVVESIDKLSWTTNDLLMNSIIM
jgi:hypothetical protein